MSSLLLVDMVHPVGRHGSFGAWHRLIGGMRSRCGKVRTGKDGLVAIVEEPILAGFETANDGMARRMKMAGCMSRGGRVATSDMTALGAAAKVDPPAARLEAFLASGSAWRDLRVYTVSHVVFLPIAGRTQNTIAAVKKRAVRIRNFRLQRSAA